MAKFKVPYKRVICDDFEIELEDGTTVNPREKEFIVFKKKLPADLIRLMIRLMALENLDDDDPQAQQEMGLVLDKLIPRLADVISKWNWKDIWAEVEEGEKLPYLGNPTEDVLWSLDIYTELFYIVGKLMEDTQAPKENN